MKNRKFGAPRVPYLRSAIRAVIGLAIGFGLVGFAPAADSASAPSAGRTQSPAEGKLDFKDISGWLPGAYDNEPQRFFLEGMKRGGDAPARTHVTIRAYEGDTKSGRFLVEERDGSEHDAIARRALWQLVVDDRTNFVHMMVTPADATGAATSAAGNCSIHWTREAAIFRGTRAAGCARSAGTGLASRGKLLLSADELWVDDSAAPVASTLLKAASYDCFVAVRLANGKPHAMTGLTLHDRGGSIALVTPEEPARQLTLILRRGLWPSNSGNNFTQLLSVYLYEAGKANTLANGWTAGHADRVGFGVGDELPGGQQASARCKKISSAGD
ncbi:MAG: hypothetical protein R3F58_12570 [Steroidobacteraceae bacterium]